MGAVGLKLLVAVKSKAGVGVVVRLLGSGVMLVVSGIDTGVSSLITVTLLLPLLVT